MTPRYTRPEMGHIWSRQHYFQCQLEVEIAVCEAWAEVGLIPKADIEKIRSASFSIDRIDEIESTTDHETDAFVAATAETLGPESRWLHYGLTSSDVLDTGLSLQLVAAADQLLERLRNLESVASKRALEHKQTLTIARTHGIHAEPTTFGFKLLVWVDEIRRQIRRLEDAKEQIAYGKISGSVGTHANVPPQVEEIACANLGLNFANVSNQILQRDRHAQFLTTLAIIGGSLEKFATELRSLQRTEIGETEEHFGEGQHGSSSMPHKRNPFRLERICGLARLLRANAHAALENMALWHERDMSNSSLERVILPDATIALDFMLWQFGRILGGLRVNVARMRENLDFTHGLIYSQGILLALIEAGMSRQGAYAAVHKHAMQAFNDGTPLNKLLAADSQVTELIDEDSLRGYFQPDRHLKWIDTAYSRLGLDSSEDQGG